jgi:hypothetical protein
MQDHPKDDEYLNWPLANYPQMQAIFGSGVATRRFPMGSNEPLGDPSDATTIDVDVDAPAATETDADYPEKPGKPLGKRKRRTTEEEGGSMRGLSDAVWGFVGAVTSSINSEGTPGIVKAIMDCPNYTKAQLMFCLDHLMEHKRSALGFMEMHNEERDLWLACHLSKHNMFG